MTTRKNLTGQEMYEVLSVGEAYTSLRVMTVEEAEYCITVLLNQVNMTESDLLKASDKYLLTLEQRAIADEVSGLRWLISMKRPRPFDRREYEIGPGPACNCTGCSKCSGAEPGCRCQAEWEMLQ